MTEPKIMMANARIQQSIAKSVEAMTLDRELIDKNAALALRYNIGCRLELMVTLVNGGLEQAVLDVFEDLMSQLGMDSIAVIPNRAVYSYYLEAVRRGVSALEYILNALKQDGTVSHQCQNTAFLI